MRGEGEAGKSSRNRKDVLRSKINKFKKERRWLRKENSDLKCGTIRRERNY